MKEIAVVDLAKEASDGSREHLSVRFTPFETGWQSTEIVYSINSKKLDRSVFRERAISKFGAPDSEVRNPELATWIGDEDLVLDIYPAEEKLVLKILGLRISSKASTGLIERTLRNTPMKAPAETTF